MDTLESLKIPYTTTIDALMNIEHDELVQITSNVVKYHFLLCFIICYIFVFYLTIGRYCIDGENNEALSIEKLSDQYKQQALANLPKAELIEIMLQRPTVYLAQDDKNTFVVNTRIELQPISNMVFTRDQQVPFYYIATMFICSY